MYDDAHELFNDVVDSIYASVVKPTEWPAAVRKIAELHHAEYAALLTPSLAPEHGGYIVHHGLPEATLAEWPKHVHDDPWVAAAIRNDAIRDGVAWTGEDLVADEQLVASNYYRNFLSHTGIRWLLTGCVFSGVSADMPMTVCTAYNPERGVRFTSLDAARHKVLLRHLSRAIGAMYRLRDLEFRAATSVQALERLPSAILLLSERGNVLFANRAAHTIVAQSDGLTLRSGHPMQDGLGWLKCASAAVQLKLDEVVKRTLVVDVLELPHFVEALAVARPSGKRPYLVRTCPLSTSVDFADCPARPAALMFLSDPDDTPVLDADSVVKLFRLTKAELKVAQQLLGGAQLAQIAASLGVGEPTVKTHLKNIFLKTDTRRQPQLVRLLLELCR